MDITYLTLDRVIELNIMALAIMPAKKADQAKLASRTKLQSVLDACEEQHDDVFDKAAILLAGLVKTHPFASGNRRTAFLAAKEFLRINKKTIGIPDDPTIAITLRGIREGYYTQNEIMEWIHHGKIRPFRR